jgi:signal transduction histidine kinase
VRLVPRSLRVRLVVVFAVGASVALVLGLVLLYVLLDRQLWGVLDADLARRGDDLAAAVAAGDAGVVRADPLAQLYAADGSVLAGSPTLGDRPLLDARQLRGVSGAELATVTPTLTPGAAPAPVRLLVQRIDDRVLAVGVPAGPVQAARDRLVAVLLVAAPLLVGLVSIAGWLVVRAALRPVAMLTREAAAISSLDTDQRLPPVPGDDEIAELARTLDGMLDRLGVAFAREKAFVDDASHELRTPIAVLRGEIELALSAADDPDEVERSLRAALAETERLARLAEDLLLLARQRAGVLAIQREPVDLLDVAVTHARTLEPVLGLSIDVSGDPVVLEADPDRLGQVLANLAANSAAAGAATVQVRVAGDRGDVVLEVADDGPGVPADLLGSAFERFVRGDDARTRGRTGAGLGLSIVRAIVTAHGGTVQIRNGGPLGGAVVAIRLPER